MSARTLTRRLKGEGTTYEVIVDELRSKLALEYLTRIGMQINEIAYELGYTNQCAFNHAFKRWFGMPPSKYRKTIHLSPSGLPMPLTLESEHVESGLRR